MFETVKFGSKEEAFEYATKYVAPMLDKVRGVIPESEIRMKVHENWSYHLPTKHFAHETLLVNALRLSH